MEAKARAERPSLVASVAARTRSGARKASNEDAIGFAGEVSVMASGSVIELEANVDGGIMCLVADGAGGHPGGDQASQIVVEHILAQAERLRSAEELGRAISSAHHELCRVMATNQHWHGMGATVAAVSLRTCLTSVVGGVGRGVLEWPGYVNHGAVPV